MLQTLKKDAKGAAFSASLGLAVFCIVDVVATIFTATGSHPFGTWFRLPILTMGLAVYLFPFCFIVLFATCAGVRIAQSRWHKISFAEPETLGFGDKRDGNRIAAWMWGCALAIPGYLFLSTATTIKFNKMFKEPELTALVLSGAQVAMACAAFVLGYVVFTFALWLGAKLPEKARSFSPLHSPPMAALVIALVGIPVVKLALKRLPQLAPLVPWRHFLSLACLATGVYLSGTMLRWLRNKKWGAALLTTKGCVLFACAMLLVCAAALTFIGADSDTKGVATSASPTLAATMDSVRSVTDVDGDGFGSLLGENDCAPFNGSIHPKARDIPDNGIDENCDGNDFKLGRLPAYKSGQRMPVPEGFREKWNVLFITVDTVRYDRTSLAKYKRDTTPNLAELAKRSVSFSFANAPSAGTMASIPAIFTSKFFHSGIALDEDRPRGAPPILKESNLLMAEVFKRNGYRTGAILSHDYFNNWGMDQGIDDYDNSLGKKREPFSVTSEKLTDRSISWIGKQNRQWFLWVHYLDPHGRYVSHPGETSYGESESDLYDGEIHFTDKHLGRLFDYLAHSKHNGNTIIVVTSDHGDAFGEHGYINHAVDLHRELIHVPLIVHIPNIEPRVVPGPVSPIDVFPTLADILGEDLQEQNLEGESLVPQLFYKQDAKKRIVFSETNFPKERRAIVSDQYKLILDVKSNVMRLYNLHKDPLEKDNVANKDSAGRKKMRALLDEWIERVMYARDPESNQAIAKLAKHLIRERPPTATPVEGVSVLDGAIEVDSFELDRVPKAGEKVKVTVLFRVNRSTERNLKLQAEIFSEATNPRLPVARSKMALTGKGLFPTSRWHSGELVRDEFVISVPPTWSRARGPVQLGLRFQEENSQDELGRLGPAKAGDPSLQVLGKVPWVSADTEDSPQPSDSAPIPTLRAPTPRGVEPRESTLQPGLP